MNIRVLIVDDSVVFRTQITNALRAVPGIEVVGTAPTGEVALQKLSQISVDLVTLDMEMPGISGIEVLRQMKVLGHKAHVIVFSSQTTKGAERALEALREGASDIVAKPSSEVSSFEQAADAIGAVLIPKIQQFLGRKTSGPSHGSITASSLLAPKGSPATRYKKISLAKFEPSVVVIGSSTGGPSALETIFERVKAPFKIPILIAQHMPPLFTEMLARRIHNISGCVASEGKHDEIVQSNRIYVAPGDYHMLLKRVDNQVRIQLNQEPQRNSVRPAVDTLFETAAEVYGQKTLGIVLTGMGEDGLMGARAIKAIDGGIAIQNQASCVVFGMPGAVDQEKLQDDQGDLGWISSLLNRVSH